MLNVNTGILPEWYTPKQFRDAEGKPVEKAPQFLLRPMNGPEKLIAQDECYDTDKSKISGRGYTQILEMTLMGWKNVFDPSQNEVPFTGKGDIKLLPFNLIVELTVHVVTAMDFKGEDAKNS